MQTHLRPFTGLKPRRRARGMTLMEVAISMFIFSVSVLAYSQMQSGLFHQGMDNRQRSIALWKAEELIDLITANSTPAALQRYTDAVSDADICAIEPANDCTQAAGTGTAPSCSVSELAAYDVWSILCDANTGVAENLLEFSADLTCNNVCGDDSGMTLEYRWLSVVIDSDKDMRSMKLSEKEGGAPLSEDKLTMVFQP